MEAPMTNHLLPNLSERRPKSVMEMVEHVVQMIENKLELALGPRLSRKKKYIIKIETVKFAYLCQH